MSVELEPSELGFRRPLTQEASQTLRLRNPNNDPVAFKVKTTAPKQYCVRPNSGRIEVGGHVDVQVLLQAMKEDPPADAKCRDKFLVQSVTIDADSDANVAQVWANVESAAKSPIQEKKIRVSFLPAGHDGANGASGNEQPTAHSQSSDAQQLSQSAISEKTTFDDTTEAGNQTALGSAASAVSNALPSQGDLSRQLENAKAEIARLTKQADEGLRQRKTAQGSEKSSASNQSLASQPAPGGVSVKITALLCLVCFLLAYLFF